MILRIVTGFVVIAAWVPTAMLATGCSRKESPHAAPAETSELDSTAHVAMAPGEFLHGTGDDAAGADVAVDEKEDRASRGQMPNVPPTALFAALESRLSDAMLVDNGFKKRVYGKDWIRYGREMTVGEFVKLFAIHPKQMKLSSSAPRHVRIFIAKRPGGEWSLRAECRDRVDRAGGTVQEADIGDELTALSVVLVHRPARGRRTSNQDATAENAVWEEAASRATTGNAAEASANTNRPKQPGKPDSFAVEFPYALKDWHSDKILIDNGFSKKSLSRDMTSYTKDITVGEFTRLLGIHPRQMSIPLNPPSYTHQVAAICAGGKWWVLAECKDRVDLAAGTIDAVDINDESTVVSVTVVHREAPGKK